MRYTQQDSGFTVLEILVVVLMISVLAAIVSPGWLAFVNRQRLNKANDVILAALQQAQREAKRTKLSYSVSLKTENNVPQIAVFPSDSDPKWQNLGEGLGIQLGQLVLGTNLSHTANTVTSPNVAFDNSTKAQTITFDYMGTLPNADFGTVPTDSSEVPGLKVVVALQEPGSTTLPSDVKRCVIVQTLLGAMRTAKDDNCN